MRPIQNPCLVFGEILHECADPSSLNTSVAGFYKFTQPPAPEMSSLTSSAGNWVDVRDVAEAHVLALTVKQAAGERYIVSAGPFANGQFTEWLRANAADEKLKVSLPAVDEKVLKEAIRLDKAIVSSGAKAEKELGLNYRSFDDCTKDSACCARLPPFPASIVADVHRPGSGLRTPVSPVYESLQARFA